MRGMSGYWLRIFISSTDYDLRDLRGELCDFLSRLCYQPILSSEGGFPDLTPQMEPHESCLHVLRQCPVMVLVIDGRYSAALDWPSFPKEIGGARISPTHAEYRFAHFYKQRMIVYVRDHVLAHYETYREAMKPRKDGSKPTHEEVVSALSFPGHIDPLVLKFVAEVKTSKPIPWISGFRDVVDLKNDLQQRLTNELAEIVMANEGRFDFALNQMSKMLDGLDPDARRQALLRVNVAREVIAEGEARIAEAEKTLEQTKSELKTARGEATEAKAAAAKDSKSAKADKERLSKALARVSELETRLAAAERERSAVNKANVTSIMSGSALGATGPSGPTGPADFVALADQYLSRGVTGSMPYLSTAIRGCATCGATVTDSLSYQGGLAMTQPPAGRECEKCHEWSCAECWRGLPSPMVYGPQAPTNFYAFDDRSRRCPKCGTTQTV
jgi:hypothetical protein